MRPLLHRQRGEAEHRERIDTAHRDGDAGKILLLRVAERLGKERFDFWFHEDTEVVIDVANRKVAFSVRGSPYMVNQIKKNCGVDIGAAISEFHPGFESVFVPKPEQELSRAAEVADAMALAKSVNAESAERARLKEERLLKAKEEARKKREEHDTAAREWQAKQAELVTA